MNKQNKNVSLCQKKSSNNKFNKPVWMKNQTETAINNKHAAWHQYLVTKHPRKKEEYRKARNKVTHQTTEDRKGFERKLAAEIKENNKAFWKYAASNRKTKKQIPNLKKKDGSTASTDKEKAETLNEQFTSVFTQEDLQRGRLVFV